MENETEIVIPEIKGRVIREANNTWHGAVSYGGPEVFITISRRVKTKAEADTRKLMIDVANRLMRT